MEDLNCALCGEEYNSRRNLPRLFPNCGHTFCSACISKLIEEADGGLCCPEDGVECQFFNKSIGIGSFPLNFVLQKLLELKPVKQVTRNLERPKPARREQADSHYCNEHSKVAELVCITDKCVICTDCALFGTHKAHCFMKMKDFKCELKSKLIALESQAEVVRLKPLMASGEQQLLSLRGKVEAHKAHMRRNIRSYIDAVIEELQSRASELEQMILSKFSKFDCGISVIAGTAAQIQERYQVVEHTVAKIRSQVNSREYDYAFLMNSLYTAESSAFNELKEIDEELTELEATTYDIIDAELQKYTIVDDVDTAASAAVKSIDMRYCNIPCSGVADRPSGLEEDDSDQEPDLITFDHPASAMHNQYARGRDAVPAKRPIRSQPSCNDASSNLHTRNALQNKLDRLKLNNETPSLLDIQIAELDGNLTSSRPTHNKTPLFGSTYNPINLDASSRLQTAKRNSDLGKTETQRNQLISSLHALNFGPDIIEAMENQA